MVIRRDDRDGRDLRRRSMTIDRLVAGIRIEPRSPVLDRLLLAPHGIHVGGGAGTEKAMPGASAVIPKGDCGIVFGRPVPAAGFPCPQGVMNQPLIDVLVDRLIAGKR